MECFNKPLCQALPRAVEDWVLADPRQLWSYRPAGPHKAQPGFRTTGLDFPGGTVVNNPPANAGHTGSSPGPGRSHMPWSS